MGGLIFVFGCMCVCVCRTADSGAAAVVGVVVHETVCTAVVCVQRIVACGPECKFVKWGLSLRYIHAGAGPGTI